MHPQARSPLLFIGLTPGLRLVISEPLDGNSRSFPHTLTQPLDGNNRPASLRYKRRSWQLNSISYSVLSSLLLFMARAWLIDCRGLAKKVKNAGLPAAYQIKDCGANKQCPNCHFLIDNSDVSHDWPGFPAGIKFDPSDIELLEHLAAKHGIRDEQPHALIDEFIPTLEGDDGICYTHPENLPGAKKDGSSVHFFYKITNAYGCGQRKRRKIQDQESIIRANVRWHKTGKTKPVMDSGLLKGFKKIMVLYASSKGGSKPDKCNWVMHQYHLGATEDEKEGENVVSKIFYQPQKEPDKSETPLVTEESDMATAQEVPRTPKTNTPDPPRAENTPYSDCSLPDYFMQSVVQEAEHWNKRPRSSCCSYLEDGMEYPSRFPGKITDLHQRDGDAPCGISDLENLELDTPPDFQLSDLQFASQDSVFDWLDRM